MERTGCRWEPGISFRPFDEEQSDAALSYIAERRNARDHKGYKCRMRSPWWKVPRVSVPDAFLTYMNHDTPRIVTNRAGLGYLNSIHGVTFGDHRRSSQWTFCH